MTELAAVFYTTLGHTTGALGAGLSPPPLFFSFVCFLRATGGVVGCELYPHELGVL